MVIANKTKNQIRSIRPFIGAKDFELSRTFYQDLGFEEKVISADLSLFNMESISFYLQRYYVKDWIDNSMIFVEVENLDEFWKQLESKDLPQKYAGTRLVPIRHDSWGSEGFLHDPSGILWHFGQFRQSATLSTH